MAPEMQGFFLGHKPPRKTFALWKKTNSAYACTKQTTDPTVFLV